MQGSVLLFIACSRQSGVSNTDQNQTTKEAETKEVIAPTWLPVAAMLAETDSRSAIDSVEEVFEPLHEQTTSSEIYPMAGVLPRADKGHSRERDLPRCLPSQIAGRPGGLTRTGVCCRSLDQCASLTITPSIHWRAFTSQTAFRGLSAQLERRT